MAHVFISYVRADADKVDRLALDLYRHGIDAWTDRDLRPGQRWKFTIRQAIRQGAAFLACFSPEVFERDRTYMYEEITTAVEVLRETQLIGRGLSLCGWTAAKSLISTSVPA